MNTRTNGEENAADVGTSSRDALFGKFTDAGTVKFLKEETEGGKFRKKVNTDVASDIVRSMRPKLKGRYPIVSTAYCPPGELHPVYAGKEIAPNPEDRIALATHYRRVVDTVYDLWFEISPTNMPSTSQMTRARDDPFAFSLKLMMYKYSGVRVYHCPRNPTTAPQASARRKKANETFTEGMFYVSVSECYALGPCACAVVAPPNAK